MLDGVERCVIDKTGSLAAELRSGVSCRHVVRARAVLCCVAVRHLGLSLSAVTKIGIPAPEFFAPFVGAVEIGCGLLVVLGLVTRLAAVPLLIDIVVAIATTKIPMLPHSGSWAAAHESRTDYSMLLGLIFLLVVGGGRWSLDTWWRGAGARR